MHTDVVHAELELRLVVPGGPDLPVVTDLSYSADDPWAVRIAFRTGSDAEDGTELTVEWLLGRQLLADGLAGPVGDGDVRVWPGLGHLDAVVHLAMSSPSGSAMFHIDRSQLAAFLRRTYEVVALGAESGRVDVDVELRALLGDRC